MAEYDINFIYKLVRNLGLSRNRLKEIVVNLFFLKNGLKQTLLWDFSVVDQSKLLKLQALFEDELVILRINGDYVLTLRPEIDLLSDRFVNYPPKIINVSEELREPVLSSEEIFKSIKIMVAEVASSISKSKGPLIDVEVDAGWNISTLYGVILGFPFVYWSRGEGNCLSDCELVVCKVRGEWSNFTCFPTSFSVPKSV